MKVKIILLALFISFFSLTARADNYDMARKLQQQSKEVEDYQKSRMNGTYVDYSETPTWVKVIYGIVGAGIFIVCVLKIMENIQFKKEFRRPKVSLEDFYKKNAGDIPKMTLRHISHVTVRDEELVVRFLYSNKLSCLDYDYAKRHARVMAALNTDTEKLKSAPGDAAKSIKKDADISGMPNQSHPVSGVKYSPQEAQADTQTKEPTQAITYGSTKLIETDFEKYEQRRGNIYKAAVTHVDSASERCVVNYGEDRQGFLPFAEISRRYFGVGQDTIREGDSLPVQVDKEEAGDELATLTSIISLRGRHLVLMPNNPHCTGVSPRFEAPHRKEIEENLDQLEYPKGMSVLASADCIGRTAGDLQLDLNDLLRLWDTIDVDAKARAEPGLIYREPSTSEVSERSEVAPT